MKRSAVHSYRAKQRNVTIALEWLWLALGFVVLAGLIAFTRLPWPQVLIFSIFLPFGLGIFVSDLRKGEMAPFVKGFWKSYRREQEPVAFWLSLAWNAVLLSVLLVALVAGIADGGTLP